MMTRIVPHYNFIRDSQIDDLSRNIKIVYVDYYNQYNSILL